MSLKHKPPFIFLLCAGLMYLLAEFLPVGYYDFVGRQLLMMILVLIAIIIMVIAILQFYRANTTVDPVNPSRTTTLVTNGIYNYSRNPMYLGMLLFLLTWGLWLGNVFNIILAAGFVAVMNKFQILPEENALQEKFGKEYDMYCKFVRRWF